MPILGDRLFNELDQERVVCITGALSGGKSRLAFDIALHYWRRGYRVKSNVGHNFTDWMVTHPKGLLYRTFNILDEGGEYVREAKVGSLITRSAGKADYYAIFSGKRLPHKDLCNVIIKPRFDFWQNYGIPMILWRVKVKSEEPYKYPVWQWLPHLMHGTYSTLSSSQGIENFLVLARQTIERLAQDEGEEAGESVTAGLDSIAEDLQTSGVE